MTAQKHTDTPTVLSANTAAGDSGEVTDLSDAASVLYGGRYELLDLVGAGGAGTVYRARDTELDEVVALKVLRPELIRSATVIERFRSEVKLARRVTHRNVARMFDIGEHQGERFLTMEFVEGEMLSARIFSGAQGASRPLPLPLILDVIKQMCAGLTAAHSVGVIHRDLKPDNVIIGKDGRVVITDFGIARALQPSQQATAATNEFVGTPEYMSPEQAEGAAIDFRTDIYSLGVMLFEMLTGGLPFTGSTPLITAAARLLKPPPDPRARRPELSEALAQVVLRCMARQPQDRFASTDELDHAVTAAIQSMPATGKTSVVTPAAAQRPTHLHPISQSEASAPAPSNDRPSVSGAFTQAGLSLDAQAQAQATAKVVAVLPFRNQGPAADQYLSDGLTDDLTDALSMVSGLRVRSRGAVQSAGGAAPADPLAVGRALSVHVLVDGSVRRMGEQLRITSRLVQVDDGSQIWAQRFDRPAADALQVSDEMAQAVSSALTGGAAGPQRKVMQDAEALDLYLRGRALFQRGDVGSLREGAALLEQAIAIRPNDPMVLTVYAQTKARLWFFGGAGAGQQAREAAERAVAAAPDMAESHVTMALVHFHLSDAAAAVRELRLALKRTPSLVDAHDLMGRILMETGPVNIGLRHFDYSFQQDPSNRRVLLDRGRAQALLGDWAASDKIFESALNHGVPPPAIWILRSRLLMWRRDRARAEEWLKRPDLQGDNYSASRGMLEVIAGKKRMEPADFFKNGLGSEQSSPRGRTFYFQLLTEFNAFYRENDAAIRELARCVDMGFFDICWMDRCPLLEELRVDLRFHALRKIVAARAAQVHEALR